jgi:hypothetical protein
MQVHWLINNELKNDFRIKIYNMNDWEKEYAQIIPKNEIDEIPIMEKRMGYKFPILEHYKQNLLI